MTEVSIMAQVGGQFRFTDGQVLHTGRYIHIAAPRELVFSLDDTRSCSRVDVKFAPRGAGCLLRLAHDGLLPELSNYARERWLGMLYGLSLVLDEASKSPRWPSSSIRASRPPLTRG
jgi:hypothetical protein